MLTLSGLTCNKNLPVWIGNGFWTIGPIGINSLFCVSYQLPSLGKARLGEEAPPVNSVNSACPPAAFLHLLEFPFRREGGGGEAWGEGVPWKAVAGGRPARARTLVLGSSKAWGTQRVLAWRRRVMALIQGCSCSLLCIEIEYFFFLGLCLVPHFVPWEWYWTVKPCVVLVTPNHPNVSHVLRGCFLMQNFN